MSFIRYKKIGQQEYAYEIRAYWDPKLGKPRQKSKYLGVVVDKEKKIFKKPEEGKIKTIQEKFILDCGDGYTLNQFTKNIGLADLLKKIFPTKYQSLLALIFHRLIYPSSMKQVGSWYEGNILRKLLPETDLSSQRISELLKYFGSEDIQKKFFKAFIKKFVSSSSGIIIDSTALPNQIDIPFTTWGYGDGSIDKQIKFLFVADKESNMPIYYRCLPGNISDVASLETTIKELSGFCIDSNFVLLDAGYYSEANITELYERKINFVTRVPASCSLHKKLIENVVPTLEKPCYATILGKKRVLVIKKEAVDLFGNKAYAYVVLDQERKSRETRDLLLRRLDEDEENILEEKMLKRGVMILISSTEIAEAEIVSTYYLRQSIERLFCFSKSDLNLLPLRIHSQEAMQGFLFITFLALYLFMMIKEKLPKKTSVEDLLLSLRNIKCKVFDDDIIIQEQTKKQQELLQSLDIIMPKSLGI